MNEDNLKPKMENVPGLPRSKPERYPLDVFSYTRECVHCLQERRFLACIAMASTAVEIILNRDSRVKKLPNYKSRDGWAYLNNRTLRVAGEQGLPVHALLLEGDDLNGYKPVTFVERRNKIAHGEIGHLIEDLSDYDPTTEQMATEQITRMCAFVSEWYNTAPDVQEGHILNNRWPDL